jgi:hypothetical protein
LEHLCAAIHKLRYAKEDKAKAKRYLPRLQRVLAELPKNNQAILREDGLALLGELTGRIAEAIRHRRREITLMEKLHEDVESRDYTSQMKASILVNRDADVLQGRRSILKSLEKQAASDGVP